MKRTLTVIALMLTLCLVSSFLPLTSSAAEVSTWDGSAKSEGLRVLNNGYAIDSAADMALFVTLVNNGKNFAGKTVYLTTDIKWNDITNIDSWTASTTGLNAWTPIGGWGKEFKGTFDGQGHTLSGLYMVKTSGDNYGVFGATDSTTIKNLKVTDSKFFYTTSSSGGLVGNHRMNSLTVKNVYVDIDIVVTGSPVAIGGMVGNFHGNGVTSTTAHRMTFENCVFAGTVTSPNTYVGGFLGNYAASATVNGSPVNITVSISFTDCLMSGSVGGNAGVGGFIGATNSATAATADGLTVTMTDCMVTGTITDTENPGWFNHGALFSGINTVKATSALNNVWYLDSLNKDTYANSVVNKAGTDLKATIATNVVEKTATEFTALDNVALTAAGFDNWEKTSNGVMPKMDVTPVEEYNIPVVEVAPAADASVYNGTKSTALRTEGDNVYIDSAADLALFADQVTAGTTFADKTVILTKDIIWNTGDASRWSMTNNPPKYAWACGAWGKRFMGTFDGQGHVISGLYVSATADNIGFFNAVQGEVTVKNLAIVNSCFTTTGSVANLGGIFGVVCDGAKATIDNVFVDTYNVAPSGANVGGLMGRLHMGDVTATITNSVFAGVAIGQNNVGGLIGIGYINGKTSSPTITITDSANYGLVYGASNAAQIVGYNENGPTTLTNVIAAGYANDGNGAAFQAGGRTAATLTNCLVEKGHAPAQAAAVPGYAEIETADLLGKVPTGFTNWEAKANKLPMPKVVLENEGGAGGEGENEPGKPQNPGTSDWAAPSMILAVMAVATGAAVVLRKKVSE